MNVSKEADSEFQRPLTEYFERSDTPSKDSPVGKLMQRILEIKPLASVEAVREQARAMLARAAGNWRYVSPVVLTLQEKAARDARFASMRAKQGSKVPAQRISGGCINDAEAA